MNALIDTNVLLDVLARREPFYKSSAAVWTLAERGSVKGLVSVVSLSNVYYIVRKWGGLETARRAVVLLRDVFAPLGCDATIINQAVDAAAEDFEDAVQYFTALHAGADCIVTRKPDDFPRSPAVPVLSPTEFLARPRAE